MNQLEIFGKKKNRSEKKEGLNEVYDRKDEDKKYWTTARPLHCELITEPVKVVNVVLTVRVEWCSHTSIIVTITIEILMSEVEGDEYCAWHE